MANTTFSEIIELTLHLMHDYQLDGVILADDEETLNEVFAPYFKIAAGEFEAFQIDFDPSQRDDGEHTFLFKLTDGQQLMYAKMIIIAYLTKEMNDILQMKLHLQDGDFKTFAERNNLEGKRDLVYTLREELNYSITKTGYKGYDWK